MAVSIVGTSSSPGSGNGYVTSMPVTVPATVQSGDTAFIAAIGFHATAANSVMTTPTGWTLVEGPISTTTSTRKTYLFRKTLTAAEAGSTVTVQPAGSVQGIAGLIVLRGGDFHVSATPATQASGSTSTVPAVTPTVDDAYHIALNVNSGKNATAPAGWTEVLDELNYTAAGVNIHVRQATGGANTSTGTDTITLSASGAAATFRVAVSPTSAYKNEVLADAPWAYLELESGTAADSSGNGRNGSTFGSPTTATGQVGNATVFNGTSQYMNLNTALGSTVTALTYEAWIKAPSNGGMTSNLNSIIRQAGTDTTWLRVRGSSNVSNPGRLEANITNVLVPSTTRVDDGNWHHVAVTLNGSAISLYVDGVLENTGTATKSTFAVGTVNSYIGSTNTTSDFFTGTIDELAVYNTALSGARIAAHYTAGGGSATTPASYTAQPMTASATFPGGKPTDFPGGYAAQPMTADAEMPGGRAGRLVTVAITHDTYIDGATVHGSETSLDPRKDMHFTIPSPSINPDEEIVGVALVLNARNTGTYTLSRITSAWSESTLNSTNQPTSTVVDSIVSNSAGSTAIRLNLMQVIAATNFGVKVDLATADGIVNFPDSTESGTPANRPYIEYLVSQKPMAAVVVNPDPITATAAMPDATIEGVNSVSVGSTPMTASAELVDAVVEAVSVVDVQAEPMDAYAVMLDGQFALPVNVVAEPLEASATVVDAAVDTVRAVAIAEPPMTATAVLKRPQLVNGNPIVLPESEDAYFQRVFAEEPVVWFRLADHGSVAVDRMGGLGGTYHGVQVGQNDGPEDRHSVHFDGDAFIEQLEPSGTNADEAWLGAQAFTLEFSFRTDKANAFLMSGRDSTQPVLNQTPTPARELFLRNGRIAHKTHYFANSLGFQKSPYEFAGFRNLADNQWHHVIVKGYNHRFNEPGVEIWVDGHLEVRRTSFSGAGPWVGFPDFIGSRPNMIDGVAIDALPSSQNFEGDMSEVVFYKHLVSDHEITRHFYDFMGWKPIEADPIESFAFMTNGNRGKGNQKRMLVLTFTEGDDAYSIGGDQYNGKMNFNAFVGYPSEFNGYKVFYRDVDSFNGQAYRDPVTDQQTLINLEHDLDIDEYDVIGFKEWPDEGAELDSLNSLYPGALERLTNQLRWANDRGVGLFITHPKLAVDLGIVDRVELVPTLKEQVFSTAQGNAFGNYDYGSAYKFPWNIVATAGLTDQNPGSAFNGEPQNFNGAFLANKAFFYEDMNFNNRFRVRALIEGLTDIPSYMIEDAIYHVDFDPWGWQSTAYKYLHRYEGLQIGDEFIFHGTNVGGSQWGSWNYDDFRVGRPKGYYAAPLANVKAGVVVTTFGAAHWHGQSQVDNPYRDYATTIVLRPGDTLKGRPVRGKIYVNFTEQPSRQPETVAIQLLPDNDNDFPHTYKPDTAAQREWDWSDTRKSLRSTNASSGGTSVSIALPDGTTQQIKTNSDAQISMTRSHNLFDLEWKASWQMNRRGLWWLGQKVEIDPGAATVAAEPMVATADAVAPTVVAQRSAVVSATPMAALAVMPKVAEDTSGEAEIHTLPMTAHATFTGYGKTITAEPMTAEAVLVENFNMVHASGEQVVLYLHGVDLVTLYLKEDA